MKLEKRLKKNSDSNLWNKILIIFFASLGPLVATAQPVVNDISFPPTSFTLVEDKSILDDIGLTPGPAWCYNVEANSIIITAPARERAKCELKLIYELEKQKVKRDFEVDNLKLRIDTLINQHTEINLIKDREIDRLTEAALKRPNDYTAWWGAGGFLVGTITTIAVVLAINN